MTKIIIATSNPSKFSRFKNILSEINDLEILSLSDLPEKINVVEDGTGPENAFKKANPYTLKYDTLALGIDEELYLDFLSPKEQPGVNVRRCLGREATDKELLDYFIKIRTAPEDKRTGRFVFNFCLVRPDNKNYFLKYTDEAIFKSIEGKYNPSYPLGGVHYISQFNKYGGELTQEELAKYDYKLSAELIKFVKQNIV